MTNRKAMIDNLKSLNLEDAISDTGASVDGTPAVLLYKNGKEEYYTGFDICQDKPTEDAELNYQNYLTENFS